MILHDLNAPIPAEIQPNIRRSLDKLKLPDITDVNISILKKSKEQKKSILADSWGVVTLDSIHRDWDKLIHEVLTPAFQRAIEAVYFEIIHWKTRIRKVAGSEI